MYEKEYARLREGFQRLREDFLKAQSHWPSLYWDWFAASPAGWEWIRTMKVETPQCWEVPPEGEECYRYTGSLAGLEEFRRLAETGVRLFKGARWLARRADGVKGCRVWITRDESQQNKYLWMTVVQITALNRMSPALWVHPVHLDLSGCRRGVEQYLGVRFTEGEHLPEALTGVSLVRDIWLSSAEAIYSWLNPGEDHLIVGEPIFQEPIIALPEADWRPNPPPQNLPDGPLGHLGFRLDGKEIEVKGNPRRLLELLWARETVSQQEALDHVYGHDAEEKEGALTNMVRRLRERLEVRGIKRRISLADGKAALLRVD